MEVIENGGKTVYYVSNDRRMVEIVRKGFISKFSSSQMAPWLLKTNLKIDQQKNWINP